MMASSQTHIYNSKVRRGSLRIVGVWWW